MIEQIINIVFYLLLVVFMAYSLLTIYALLKFGRTKTVGIVVSLVFLGLSAAVYITALIHIHNIAHP